MIKRWVIMAGVGAWLGVAGTACAGDYVPGLDDVPLAPGLVAGDEPDLTFDKPEGRLVESSATTSQPTKGIKEFYASTLPQMGWVPEKNGPDEDIYRRDQELLSVITRRAHNRTDVTFRLSPPHPKP